MFYENSFRRHLCDMHIESWNDSFLSEFSPEDYFQNLVRANVQTAMIYFQSHVGYCYFPTQTGEIHKAFAGREDTMKRLIDLCRAGGMSVVGYYSVIYNNWAHDHYPEWRMVEKDGLSKAQKGSRYGLCCPNNADYRFFITEQMKEMADYFNFDGIFFDMLFWPHACYCDACKEKWKNECGNELPEKEDLSDPLWQLQIRKRREWMGEFAAMLSAEIKKIKPGIPVEMNLATLLCTGEKHGIWCSQSVNDACDYAGGDLYGGLLEQSFACKFYHSITKQQPFEYMTSRCNPNLQRHTITKSDDQLEVTTLLTCAHHGAMLMIDAIDPVGTMNPKVYERIGHVYKKEMHYEPYLKGISIADAAIYYNLTHKENLNSDNFGSHSGAVNLSKTLIENNILHDVITSTNFEKYKVIFVPYANTMEDETVKGFTKYVQNGGVLYFSGAQEPALLALLNAEKAGFTDETVTYIAPRKEYEALFDSYSEKYPLPMNCRMPVIKGHDAETVATVTLPYTKQDEKKFSSIHSNPPGISTKIPAVIAKNYGNGKIIWSAAPLENETIADYKRVLLNLVRHVLEPDPFFLNSTAPKYVEFLVYSYENRLLVSAVHLSDEEEIPVLAPFGIKIKSDTAPKEVRLLPKGESIPFDFKGKKISFQTKSLHIFDMYEIIF